MRRGGRAQRKSTMTGAPPETDALQFSCGSEELRALCDKVLARAKHWGWIVDWKWEEEEGVCRCTYCPQFGHKLR